MWNDLLILIGKRKVSMIQILAAELHNTELLRHMAAIEAEKWVTTEALYSSRIIRLKHELSELTSSDCASESEQQGE